MRSLARGFTLIELMVVIAISAVLTTLIVIPIVESFNFLRQADAFAIAKERSQQLAERIAREINVSAGVRDNSGDRGSVSLTVPAKPTSLGGPGGTAPVTLPYTKLDIVLPAQEGDVDSSGGFTNPDVGRIDPTLRSPRGQVSLPVAPGATIVRYWIGPRDPFSPYNNIYDQTLAITSGPENLMVLWRAEVQPLVYSPPHMFQGNPIPGRFVVNKLLFYDTARRTTTPPWDTWLPSAPPTGPLLDDTTFFDPNVPYPPYDPAKPDPDGTPDPDKITMVRAWMARATIVSDLTRTDMIQTVVERGTRKPVWDGSAPRLLALAQFKPTRIGGEPAEGQLAVRPGEETDNAGAIGPDVYLTRFAGWANQIIRTYPDGWDRTDANKDRYLVGRTDPTGALQGYHLYSYSPATDGSESTGGMEVFDLNAYAMTVHDGGAYPFTAALQAANGRSNWLAAANVAALKKTFEPYSPDAAAGKAVASFAISEVGDKTLTPPGNDPNNLPVIDTGLALSPLQDTGAGQPYSGAGYQINGCFNRVWNENPGLRPDIQRFVDLRVTPQGDGTGGPMDVATGFPRACVVPGSEEVFGPDQLAGLNFGQPVRYIRTTNSPGPNQYRINYVDQIEPTDYTLLGVPPPPATYDPTDLTSAVIQPRYKAGYIQLNSDPNSPLPVGTLQIYYRFQFTRPRDVFEVDYDTRQEMSILMTVRAYPSSSSFNAQSVTVPATAKVRNLLR